MKRTIVLLLAIIMVLSFTACGKKEVVYYNNTQIPTFTCATDIELSNTDYNDGMTAYRYEGSEEDIDKYIDFLKSEDFDDADMAMPKGSYALEKTIDNKETDLVVFMISDGTITVMPVSFTK